MSYGNWQNSFSARLRRTQWNMKHGRRTLSPGTKLSTSNVQRSTSKVEPATQTVGLAVAAAAHPADSKLPAPGATPGVGQLCRGQKSEVGDQKSDLRPPASGLRPKLGLRYER